MERRFGAQTDPAVGAAEGESRSFRRIQGGDAARAAEQSAPDTAPHHRSFGIILRAARGARFDLEKNPEGPGEARPVAASSHSSGQVLPVEQDQQQAHEATGGIAKRFFRSLFRP
jgi:hypothetical protein